MEEIKRQPDKCDVTKSIPLIFNKHPYKYEDYENNTLVRKKMENRFIYSALGMLKWKFHNAVHFHRFASSSRFPRVNLSVAVSK